MMNIKQVLSTAVLALALIAPGMASAATYYTTTYPSSYQYGSYQYSQPVYQTPQYVVNNYPQNGAYQTATSYPSSYSYGTQSYGTTYPTTYSATTYSYPTTYTTSYSSGSRYYAYPTNSYSYYPQYPDETFYGSHNTNAAAYTTYPRYQVVQSGMTDFTGAPTCYWSDYSYGATSCNYDPQQWVLDPYTGRWY